MIRAYAVFALLLPCLEIRTVIGAPAKESHKELEGLWRVVSAERDGKPSNPRFLESISIAGKRVRLNYENGGISFGLATLKSSKDLNYIDVLADLKENQDFTFLYKGLYSLRGDELKVCWEETSPKIAADIPRPLAFDTKRGKRRVLYVFKRAIPMGSLLQGRWKIVQARMNGTPIRELAGQTWLFDDCKVSGKDSEVSGKMMGADGEIEQHTCVCTFYQFRSPAEVRWLAVVGPKNDGGLPMIKVFSGIVSLQADTLRWCVSFSGDTSPKEFDSNKGDSQIFYILRRAKAKKKP